MRMIGILISATLSLIGLTSAINHEYPGNSFASVNTAVSQSQRRLQQDPRLIAYVGNWQTCPTTAQTDQYTHLVISFAVTYTWNSAKNVCNTNCDIVSPVLICNN
mmetsp:Transcript_47786/g.57588  ORF Transcript_47786/g.57588 Transcript_47786/m.57588 type:complete len:105 (+) Transcript_47786:72-386(+)